MVFDGKATRWLCILIYIYICILYNDLMWGHVDLVMLRSTTSFYGWPVIEVAYGETLFHSTDAVWEMKAQEEWLGVSAWCIINVWHIRVNISVGSMYIIFDFSKYKKLCMCKLISKSICSIKEHWWSLTSSWLNEIQRIFSTAHEFYIRVLLKNHRLLTISWVLFKTSLLYFIITIIIMFYLMLWKVQDKLLVYSVVYNYTHLIHVILSFLTEPCCTHTRFDLPLAGWFLSSLPIVVV